MVTASDERPGGDGRKAHLLARLPPFVEYAGVHETLHGLVLRRRPQVLADGKNLAADLSKVAH